jgi:TonB family protein
MGNGPTNRSRNASEWVEQGGPVRKILTATVVAMFLSVGLAAQDQEYKIGDGVTAPVLIKETKPKYTEAAMRRKVQGVVEISAVVQKDGKVGSMYVTRPLDDDLDVEAMEALKQWEFKPGTKEGQPVNVRVNVEMTFTLRTKK